MRILILNEYFYPDVAATAQHSTDLAVALAREGHEVSVVAGRRGYSASGDLLPGDETREGIRILRVPSLGLGKTARWRRAAHFASFLAACAWRLLWLPAYDAVIAMTTPPLFSFFGALFTEIKGGDLYVWVMDLAPFGELDAPLPGKPSAVLLEASEENLRPGPFHARAHYRQRHSRQFRDGGASVVT
jgi:putative colanic acid biosynthesis glycosyltransferase WcaI